MIQSMLPLVSGMVMGKAGGNSGYGLLGDLGMGLLNRNEARNAQQNSERFNLYSQLLNQQFQRNERLATQEFNKEMWNLENEYNSPVNQLQRAVEAGVNPNAVIEGVNNGNVTQSSVRSSPMSGGMASVSPVNSALWPNISDSFLNMANKRQAESKADLNESERRWNDASFDLRLENLKKQNAKLEAEGTKLYNDVEVANKTFDLLAHKTALELKVMAEEANKLQAEYLNAIKDLQVKDSQIANINADTLNKNANTLNQTMDLEVKSSQIDKTDAETLALKYQNDLSSIMGFPPNTPVAYANFALVKQGKIMDVFKLTDSAFAASVGDEFGRELARMPNHLLDILGNIYSGIVGKMANPLSIFTK